MIAPRDAHEPLTAAMLVELRDRYPSAARLDVCFRLARDLATCEALWTGEPVDPSRLDPCELLAARSGRLVTLIHPIDLLEAS